MIHVNLSAASLPEPLDEPRFFSWVIYVGDHLQARLGLPVQVYSLGYKSTDLIRIDDATDQEAAGVTACLASLWSEFSAEKV